LPEPELRLRGERLTGFRFGDQGLVDRDRQIDVAFRLFVIDALFKQLRRRLRAASGEWKQRDRRSERERGNGGEEFRFHGADVARPLLPLCYLSIQLLSRLARNRRQPILRAMRSEFVLSVTVPPPPLLLA
jgi:hypothetical protein